MKLYTIETKYIDYLRTYSKLANVFDNKDDGRSHVRKYLGIVLEIGEYKYYVPLSSPKDSDYLVIDDVKTIRKSIIPIIRIIVKENTGKLELKGTLKFSNMIPVPDDMITYYDISKETDKDYKALVEKEYDFIRKNQKLIMRNASVLYNQKSKENELYPQGSKKPGYLKTVLDFKYAEQIYCEFIQDESNV